MKFKLKHKEQRLDMNNLPRHIGVIMDGNGRWAKKRALPTIAGHNAGAETYKKIVRYCGKIGIDYLTVYAFSTENWSRSKEEVDALMGLLVDYLGKSHDELMENNVRMRMIGERDMLPREVLEKVKEVERYSAGNTGITVNMALSYGSTYEIANAARIAAQKVKDGEMDAADITPEVLTGLMYTADMPPVDLLIRPSGEFRISNFLLWQSAYAELWFSDILWPSFRDEDMLDAILEYQKRNRRFGGRNNEG